MNWLAHLLLSEPTPACRLGGLLPDLASAPALVGLPEEFQRGMDRHRQIDAYTDAHPVFRRSVQRFQPPLRRFGGILIDLFYDHFLDCGWAKYSDVSLPAFTAQVYASFDSHRETIPEEAFTGLQLMKRHHWLGSYGSMEGMALTLQRVSGRFRRPVDLVPAMDVLRNEYAGFQADFDAFFPELRAFVGIKG